MRLAVFSHKGCWPDHGSPSGFATDGGFPFQIQALSALFDSTVLLLPCASDLTSGNSIPLQGNRLSVVPLTFPLGKGVWRKLLFPWWVLRNLPSLLYYLFACDAIHAPIPGDVGTIGMLGGFFFRKPLFVRYCGNWLQPKTTAERFWRWFMEKTAGGRNVMLATGGAAEPPSHNPNVHWIFSTSLTQQQLKSHASSKPYPPNGHMRLINVARQEAGKGTDVLIQALPHLQRTHPGVSVEIVGDGAALSQLKALSLAPGLQGVIRFHGSVPHHRVLELLRSAYLFCFPSASEGFPKVVLEALACGLPVVSTRVSVLPQLLGSGCGILIDEATPEALARGIETALADSTTYEAMSRRAIETAQQYSLESWRDTIGGYLESAWGPLRSKVGD